MENISGGVCLNPLGSLHSFAPGMGGPGFGGPRMGGGFGMGPRPGMGGGFGMGPRPGMGGGFGMGPRPGMGRRPYGHYNNDCCSSCCTLGCLSMFLRSLSAIVLCVLLIFALLAFI